MEVELVRQEEMLVDQTTVYRVARAPGLLAGMPFPFEGEIWPLLAAEGIHHVVCLASNNPGYDPAPLKLLAVVELQDLVGGRDPGAPDREERVIREVVQQIVDKVRGGEGVVVHCQGGTGRTGTVLACALKALGVPLSDVFDQMAAVNKARRHQKYGGWNGWPESDWQKALVERF